MHQMTTQVQDLIPARRPQVMVPVIEGGAMSTIQATTYTGTTTIIISAETGEELSAPELADVVTGEAEIERGDYVTLDALESADDE